MADSINTYFSTICATSEINNLSHDVYLNDPIDTEFNFERHDNMTVLHYINKQNRHIVVDMIILVAMF